MDKKSYEEIQKRVPEVVKMKRKYLAEKMEKEYYKDKIDIYEREIKQRDNHIKGLEELIDKHSDLINNSIKHIEKLIPEHIKIQQKIKKKNRSFLKLIK